MRVSYKRIDDPEQVPNHIATVAARTVIFDVEPRVAFWDTDTATLDRGIASMLERLCDLPGVAVVVFATNSARRPTPPPNGHAHQQVLYLASAGKPLRTKPYRSLPRPGLVVGDQIPTDGPARATPRVRLRALPAALTRNTARSTRDAHAGTSAAADPVHRLETGGGQVRGDGGPLARLGSSL